jgi:hypothetical protein
VAHYLGQEAVAAAATTGNATTAEWFAQQLVDIGLAPAYHDFRCPERSHSCRSVYAVMRAAHSQGTEAVVVAVPLPARGRRLMGAAVALGMARAMLRGTWLSKSVIIVGYDAQCEELAAPEGTLPSGARALEAWLEAYQSPGGLRVHGTLLTLPCMAAVANLRPPACTSGTAHIICSSHMERCAYAQGEYCGRPSC